MGPDRGMCTVAPARQASFWITYGFDFFFFLSIDTELTQHCIGFGYAT